MAFPVLGALDRKRGLQAAHVTRRSDVPGVHRRHEETPGSPGTGCGARPRDLSRWYSSFQAGVVSWRGYSQNCSTDFPCLRHTMPWTG